MAAQHAAWGTWSAAGWPAIELCKPQRQVTARYALHAVSGLRQVMVMVMLQKACCGLSSAAAMHSWCVWHLQQLHDEWVAARKAVCRCMCCSSLARPTWTQVVLRPVAACLASGGVPSAQILRNQTAVVAHIPSISCTGALCHKNWVHYVHVSCDGLSHAGT